MTSWRIRITNARGRTYSEFYCRLLEYFKSQTTRFNPIAEEQEKEILPLRSIERHFFFMYALWIFTFFMEIWRIFFLVLIENILSSSCLLTLCCVWFIKNFLYESTDFPNILNQVSHPQLRSSLSFFLSLSLTITITIRLSFLN